MAQRADIYCGGCGTALQFCGACGAPNLADSDTPYCHVCGKLTKAYDVEQAERIQPSVEKMQICPLCQKVIGGSMETCSYCGAKLTHRREGPQAALDPRTMKVVLTMIEKVTEAKNHAEYNVIDRLTALMCDVALPEGRPRDAQEWSFSDQLRILTLIFEYVRDRVAYRGEAFGEHVRWSWETVTAGGDCDCKVVLLATMLASLNFRRMRLLILPGGLYLDSRTGTKKKIQGHVLLEVELGDVSSVENQFVVSRLDPSCQDCDVNEISATIAPLLPNFYRIPIIS